MHDLHNSLNYARGLSPVLVADNTAQNTQVIDTAGYVELEFVIATGAIQDADATFAVVVQHGENSGLSDAVDVPDSDLIGTEADAAFIFSSDDSIRKIGYKCTKRYVRLTITPANNSGNAVLAVIAVRRPRHAS